MDQTIVPSPPTAEDRHAWVAYWQTLGQAWRTEPEIEVERQIFLTRRFEIIPNVKRGEYPFRGVNLNRADVEWLIATTNSQPADLEKKQKGFPEGLDLRGADLSGLDLQELPLAYIQGGLSGKWWIEAKLEEREAATINMAGANLQKAHLEGAVLRRANLRNTNLESAHLEGADLYRTHLEGAYLRNAYLGGTCLQRTYFDTATSFEDVSIQDSKFGTAKFADTYWNDMHVLNINWSQIKVLGDEYQAEESRELKDFRRAVRAYRQLAIVLQSQGLNEEASRFAYRAHVLQRKVYWYQREIWRYLFSLFLGLFTGYGYKPLRAFISYLIVIGLFMLIYHTLGVVYGPHLKWEESLVVSMTAFHGRGFFPEQFKPSDPQALVAAIEAFVGLLIEVTFIATLTKRLFGN
jgi:uncharacterized protein YjbI with pentapeptide repeats